MTLPTLKLNPVSLAAVLPPRRGVRYATFTAGQWDTLLAAAYAGGWVLLEVDDDSRPVGAYRRPDTAEGDR